MLIAVALWAKRYFVEDFGPYSCKTVAVPKVRPNQVFRVNSTLALEVYDPAQATDYPIVAARRSDGSLMWVRAPYSMEDVQGGTIRFSGSLHVPFTDTIRLKGEFHAKPVGPESTMWTLWLLERDGEFREFFVFT